jgi:hypothetical protein
MELVKVLYADGRYRVEAHPDTVTIADEKQDASITISHAAMRELVLGWERHEMREKEG